MKLTKKEMLQYRWNGKAVIRMHVKNHPVSHPALVDQIEKNIQQYDAICETMKMRDPYDRVKTQFTKLLAIIRTVEFLTVKQEKALDMMPSIQWMMEEEEINDNQ